MLPDIVDRIYTKMDLLLFNEDDESPGYKNSEDSNQDQREKHGKIKKDKNVRSESLILKKHDKRSLQEMTTEECANKLLEVKEKIERARRRSYFTSSMPDLQRVWAPKQTKAKTDPHRKLSKRKDSDRESYDTVCETPMTDRKRYCSADDEDSQVSGTPSSGSVSKALFLDDL